MGEAMLTRKGGTTLRELVLISPPDTTQYYTSQHIDDTGVIVGARMGTYTIPLHRSAWTYTPTHALTTADTEMVITATVGRMTKTVSIPITVEEFALNFGDNTWEQIAYAAQLGIANQLWNVGDIKTTDYGSFRIIGFNYDPLDSTDARYSDASYNGNSKRAAMTLQWVSAAGAGQMNLTSVNGGGWLSCNMRTTTMANLWNNMPDDMTAVIRTVDKYTCIGGSATSNRNQVNEAADRLFLLGAYEVYSSPSGVAPIEANYGGQYEWYTMTNNPYKGGEYYEWLRSPHDPQACNGSHFTAIYTNGTLYVTPSASSTNDYYPAFCI